MEPAVDLAIVGGGVIGCSVAYHATRRGGRVALVEAERIGSGASGAAAGMLNAQAEAHEPGPFLDLLLSSRRLHGPLGEELYEATGLDPEYVWAGTLRVATDEAFREIFAAEYSWQREQGLAARWLDADEIRELEPNLSSESVAALYLPEDGQVNPPRLVQALALGATLGGARVMEATSAEGLVVKGRRVTGVRTARGEIPAGAVVLAGGASATLLSNQLGVHLPVHPVKGEILAVNARPAPVRVNIWNSECYVVPKRDGRVVIGATEEPGVYDRRPTLGGVAHLSRAAVNLVPELSRAPFASAWGGLRPGTPDGEPILGPVEGWEGLFLATGHYRNGVLLSAITGESIAALALGETSPFDVSPFSQNRFAESVTR
ncbi:MAG: glycine oxidase ThiO [Actinobacteria bacterium]|nr:glycine oxidase ThiO [Actinomycetota bacterium]